LRRRSHIRGCNSAAIDGQQRFTLYQHAQRNDEPLFEVFRDEEFRRNTPFPKRAGFTRVRSLQENSSSRKVFTRLLAMVYSCVEFPPLPKCRCNHLASEMPRWLSSQKLETIRTLLADDPSTAVFIFLPLPRNHRQPRPLRRSRTTTHQVCFCVRHSVFPQRLHRPLLIQNTSML